MRIGSILLYALKLSLSEHAGGRVSPVSDSLVPCFSCPSNSGDGGDGKAVMATVVVVVVMRKL